MKSAQSSKIETREKRVKFLHWCLQKYETCDQSLVNFTWTVDEFYKILQQLCLGILATPSACDARRAQLTPRRPSDDTHRIDPATCRCNHLTPDPRTLQR